MSLEIHGLDLRLAKKMLFTGVNLRIDKPNLVVYVIDEAGLFIEGADVNILSSGHNLNSVTDALGTALTRFMPAINNTLTVSKVGYATSSQIIYNETPSTLSVYVQLFASEIRLKVVNKNHEPIEGATCRVLNAIGVFRYWGTTKNGLSLDGVDDYFNAGVKLVSHNDSFSLYILVKQSVIQPANLASEDISSSSKAWGFYITSDGKLSYSQYSGSSGGFNRTTLNSVITETDTWYFLTLTRSDSGVDIYVNGEKQSLDSNVAVDGGVASPAFRVGVNRTAYGKFSIKNLALFNTKHDDPRVLLQLTSLTGSETDLIEGWLMDEGSGNTLFGISSSRNLTIYGALWETMSDLRRGINGYDLINHYDNQTTNANGLTTLNYQINKIHGLEVTLPGKRRFIMPFERTATGLLDWQVMLSDYLATFATDRGNILINSEPENNDANFLIE